MTYAFKHAEILSAEFNGATLLVLGLLIVLGGVKRLLDARIGRRPRDPDRGDRRQPRRDLHAQQGKPGSR